ADAEILRELALIEPDVAAAAIDIHRHDGVFQRQVSLVLEARRGFDRLNGRLRPRGRTDRQGSVARMQSGTGGRRIGLTHDWYTIFHAPSTRNNKGPPRACGVKAISR